MSGQKVKIAVQGGVARFIHSDAAMALLAPIGDVSMRRASHVDPWVELSEQARHAFIAQHGAQDVYALREKWFADLSPVGGHTAGPFDTRQAALDYEADWINRNALHDDAKQH